MASNPSTPPAWLTRTLGSASVGGIDPALIDAARADPDYLRLIEAAARPGMEKEAFNLKHLLAGIAYKSHRPEHLVLARRLFEIDPELHAPTLVWVSQYDWLASSELDLLRIAFDQRAEVSPAWVRNRREAAAILVQRLAFDTPSLPRLLPPGAPPMLAAIDDTRVLCDHHCIRAAYGVGDAAEELQAIDRLLADDATRPVNDHDAENCATVACRIRESK